MRAVVVFDLDDTLYPERQFVASGFQAAGRHLLHRSGVPGLADECLRLFAEGVRGHTFDAALERLGLPPDPQLVSELVAVYREHRPEIRPHPEVGQVLGQLRAAGCGLAVVTDGPERTQRNKLDALGLATAFDLVVYTDALPPGQRKPSPEPFRLVMQHFRAAGRACTYVADNPAKDFAGPRSLGWRCVRVRRPDGLYAHLPADGAGPDVTCIRDLRRLPALVRAGRVSPSPGGASGQAKRLT